MESAQTTGGKPHLRPDDIIDTAVDLTRRKGLDGWSVRDINREIGASMSSIYHHVGGKDEIARQVVERVLTDLPVPSEDVDWQVWFTEVLMSLRARLSHYPGVAHWMMMHGPIFPQSMTGLDHAIAMLERAGFGEDTGKVYGTIFNTALSSIAISDDRKSHAENGPRGHKSIMRQLQEHSAASPGGQTILQTMAPFAQDTAAGEAAAVEFYRFLLTSLINGIALTSR